MYSPNNTAAESTKCEANCDISKKANPKNYEDGNTTFSVIDTRWKISKDIEKTATPTNRIQSHLYRSFSSFYGKYTKTHYIQGHKINFNQFKIIEAIQSVFSDPNRITLNINNRKIREKSPNSWELNSTLLNNI